MASLLVNDLDFFQSLKNHERSNLKGGIVILLGSATLPLENLGLGNSLGTNLQPGVLANLQPGTAVTASSAATSSSGGYGIAAMATAATTAGESGISYYLSTSVSLL
ncbi:hypothetical protein [Leptothermofonsia sp. ETS-13]|uniref:hypothetical protein n=1 Tax=Leptothermofonsia sp. ETS-13 TaxID=3035696 RepID=UPI003BA36C5D